MTKYILRSNTDDNNELEIEADSLENAALDALTFLNYSLTEAPDDSAEKA